MITGIWMGDVVVGPRVRCGWREPMSPSTSSTDR